MPTPPADGKAASQKPKDELEAEIDAKLKAKKKKEERKDDFELHGIRTSPFDLAVPYFKLNNWTIFHLDLIANNRNESVEIRTGYELMKDSPHEVSYRRLIHLIKGDQRGYRLPMLLPETHSKKTVQLGIYYPDGVLPISPPGNDSQVCNRLEADQFLIMILSPEPERFRFLSGMQCVTPGSETGMYVDEEKMERRRYFYLVVPTQPDRPLLADTALAWTSTSYLIWDDLDPELLPARQQEALVDWLHWGGQLVVSGGAAATRLEQSFLAAYLPADVVGSENITDLSELWEQSVDTTEKLDKYASARTVNNPQPQNRPINILPTKPVYAAKLKPRPGAKVIEWKGGEGGLPLVVERAVGRGRVVMAAVSLYQPELVNWSGCYDTFWRKLIFRVPETRPNQRVNETGGRTYERLPAREVSRVRYVSRDLGSAGRKPTPRAGGEDQDSSEPYVTPGIPTVVDPSANRPALVDTVAEWQDEAAVPATARQTLMDATGIKIPPPRFVVVAAVAYVIALVPLNWLVCRFGLRRSELAWLAAPLIIMGFAYGIVKSAELHVGF
ncbi:MAG: hypothetical protein HY000_16120, partial [Planctomycetes bacterium]|nr:hypothetical protein [Planctomycetota bacterium]